LYFDRLTGRFSEDSSVSDYHKHGEWVGAAYEEAV
jgi:hypothetical protein